MRSIPLNAQPPRGTLTTETEGAPMPDILLARATDPYRPTSAVDTNRHSALRLIAQLLELTDVTATQHREQPSIGLWKWTEAEGIGPNAKYNTRYFSAGVMAQEGPASINHEHVW